MRKFVSLLVAMLYFAIAGQAQASFRYPEG